MTLHEQLIREGFDPVPRDDRLFDVLPYLTRDRGFELWEKWTDTKVNLVAWKFQDSKFKPQSLEIPRQKIEDALRAHQVLILH